VLTSTIPFLLFLKLDVDSSPQRIRQDCKDHPHEQSKETETTLPEIHSVHIAKDQLEGTEEKVENAQKDSREYAEIQAHRL
jgi:hypothetical protein